MRQSTRSAGGFSPIPPDALTSSDTMSVESIVFIVDDDPAFAESLSTLITSMGARTKTFTSADAYLEQFDPASPRVPDSRRPHATDQRVGPAGAAFQAPVEPGDHHHDGARRGPDRPAAMRMGAVDFLQKTFTETELYEAVQRALIHDARTRHEYYRKEAIERRFAQLTPPERSVLTRCCRARRTSRSPPASE